MEWWDRAGRVAAYAAALAISPYLLIKVSWVVGSLLGRLPVGEDLGTAEWLVLNTVTIGMAAIGLVLAFALVRPWGMRIPGVIVAFGAWTGSGFLVSILPFAVISTILDAGDAPSGEASMPVWQSALLQAGFLGVGLGLAIAVPAYLRRRWPRPFTGRIGSGTPAEPPWPVFAAAAVGAVSWYWALGGTLGLANPAGREVNWHLLGAVSGSWALAGAVALWMIARARPARWPRWLPLAVGWIASGSLFAWGAWKFLAVLYIALAGPGGVAPPESLPAALVLHLSAALAGTGMAWTIVRTPIRDEARPGSIRVRSPLRSSGPRTP